MIATLAVLAVSGMMAEGVSKKFVPSGITARLGGYSPIRAEMDAKAESIKTKPEGLGAAKYGALRFGQRGWSFVLDEPEGQASRLFVDSNGDGDLTNDPPTTWTAQTTNGLKMYRGRAEIHLADGEKGWVNLYRFDPADPQRAAMKNTVMFYPDFGCEVTFEFDGERYTSFVAGQPHATSSFWIDRDRNGQRSTRREMAQVGKPFNFTGTTYVLKVRGGELQLEKAAQALPIAPLPPNLAVGQQAPAFQTKSLDGAKINFPKAYAGKLVMLDFWATWCGPCIAELPNVKKAYTDWHDKGFDILGISFDNPNMEKKVKLFLEEHQLGWPQVYEGKGWNTTLGEQYEVTAIPFVLLVDGDTGLIVATVRNLRGPSVSEFIGKQLQLKKSGKLTANELAASAAATASTAKTISPPAAAPSGPVKKTTAALPTARTPFSAPKSKLDLTSLKPAKIELVAGPDIVDGMATYQAGGAPTSADYVPTNPSLTPLVTSGSREYQVIAGGLRKGALPYSDRKFRITELPAALEGLTMLQTKMGHKGMIDGRYSVVLSTPRPCYLFVALRDETLENYRRTGAPSWLYDFAATDFQITTDNPIRGAYNVFVRSVPEGRFSLGPCCSNPSNSSMYFAFAAEVN